MSRRQHLALIDRFYDDMWNHFDTSFVQLADYVAFIRAFAPDFHNEVLFTITEDIMTFARLSYRGTHRGEVFGICPTGRRFEYAGAVVFTVRDELISDVWGLGDVYELVRQLG